MFEKIDKRLIEKIKTQSNQNIDCIIFSQEYHRTKSELEKIFDKDFFELPFISGFAVSCNYSNIYNIAKLNCVRYISSNAKVSSLIYKSKKFMHTDNLEKKIDRESSHSVAIIDTGVYPHIDFCLGKNRIIKFVDLINNKNEIYDDNGHGTFIAGILAGNSVISKYSGIDNSTKIIVIKALDSDGETTSIKILQAMQWILDNAKKYNIKVVCMSFGSLLGEKNDPLIFGAEVLWNNGICVICAGGNSGPESSTIMSPGASKKIITVGSLDNIDHDIEVADFSSRGPVFNYYKPDLIVPGVDIISTNRYNDGHKFYTKMSGTSVSTPMVAGVASLLYKINPNYTPDQIKYMLVNSCVKISGDKNSEGFGYLDLRKLILL